MALTSETIDDLGDDIIKLLKQSFRFFSVMNNPLDQAPIRRCFQSLYGASSWPGNRSSMAVSTMAI